MLFDMKLTKIIKKITLKLRDFLENIQISVLLLINKSAINPTRSGILKLHFSRHGECGIFRILPLGHIEIGNFFQETQKA